MSSQFWWWIARSSGIVAWLVLTASVLWGILLPAKVSSKQRPAWILDLHRWLGSLTVGFTALHLVALWMDSYVEFSLVDFVVPGAAEWKPMPVALGVIALWGIVVVQLSSTAKKYLSRKLWRSLHLFSYVAFFLGTLHGVLAGTDASSLLYQMTTLVTVATVVFTTVFRVMTRRSLARAAAARPAAARPTTVRSATEAPSESAAEPTSAPKPSSRQRIPAELRNR